MHYTADKDLYVYIVFLFCVDILSSENIHYSNYIQTPSIFFFSQILCEGKIFTLKTSPCFPPDPVGGDGRGYRPGPRRGVGALARPCGPARGGGRGGGYGGHAGAPAGPQKLGSFFS